MSSFDLNDDMLSRMDPDVRKILEEAQTTYADSIRNPAQQQQKQQTDTNNSHKSRSKQSRQTAVFDRYRKSCTTTYSTDTCQAVFNYQPCSNYAGEGGNT